MVFMFIPILLIKGHERILIKKTSEVSKAQNNKSFVKIHSNTVCIEISVHLTGNKENDHEAGHHRLSLTTIQGSYANL